MRETAETSAEPWATLLVQLRGRSEDDGASGGIDPTELAEASERLEALATLIAEDPRAAGVETRDASTLGSRCEIPELTIYTTPDGLEGLVAEVERLAAELRLALRLTPAVRTDDDWRDTWKQFYAPLVFAAASTTLLVRPSWIDRKDGDPELELVLDPGRAFGTGQHETTRLCLEVLVALAEAGARPDRVLDLGCGSGILALAAARLFPRAAVVAADNDPDAADTAAENAAANALEDRLEIRAATVLELSDSFDLILANIRPGVLIPIAGEVAGRLAAGGTVVLSGVLGEEAEAVLAAYAAAGLGQVDRRDLAEWCALVLRATP
ncbi:50S ribosomal protein L11 methyltransferase [Nannocystis radixulma]|uniref:Ribosomal protein L11 methyltransferase n=1 Tax=Nannocystis radixulma TaxID=2995305 RepID=A0ABT5BII8_9BACT|nr:50S ribosomal protein L11 methyltransferase [Nannocystis radixulma]MDC0673948.1 50S ribosomal protein L11 methyltransferase [Nannocystis radixulma]